MTHRYHLTYQATPHPDGIPHASIPAGHGACDAIIMAQLLYPEDGSFGATVVTVDGRTGRTVSDDEIFKFWCVLAGALATSERLQPGKREFCETVHQIVSGAISAARRAEEQRH